MLATKRDTFVQNSKSSAQAALVLPIPVRQSLSQVELQWLDAGNFVALESYTPFQLIRILNWSLATGQQIETENTHFILIADSGGPIYATESFG